MYLCRTRCFVRTRDPHPAQGLEAGSPHLSKRFHIFVWHHLCCLGGPLSYSFFK
ncbi:hypothetical protein IC575_005843 [Cucumis melo]